MLFHDDNVTAEKTNRNRTRTSRLAARLRVLITLCGLAVLPGCNYFILAGYLIGGPPSIEPDFDAMTKKSMTAKDVTVAVVCYAPIELKYAFEDLDDEVARYVAYRLVQHHIKVVSPDLVHDWLDKHPNWDHAEEIGEAFDATYVVHIDMLDYTLYAENSAELFQGQADAVVSVFEMDGDGNGDKIYEKEIASKYPLLAPRSTYEVSYESFKRQYLTRLSEEIGRLFYEYYNGDDIPDAT